jgi:hypothetical protein
MAINERHASGEHRQRHMILEGAAGQRHAKLAEKHSKIALDRQATA